MIVYFADRRMNILGQASTSLPESVKIVDDLKCEEIDTGIATFDFRIPYTKSTRKAAESWAAVGNYVLRKNGNEAEFYTIIETETDTDREEVYAYAEDAGLDLLNEIVGAYEADKAYPAAYYIEKFAYDSGFEIGLNEISDLSRKLKWDGEATATERIASVATQFDNAEISYSFEVDKLSVVHKYINIYKSRGKDVGVELRLNRDVDRIITKKSVANLATSLIVTGGRPEGKDSPITLAGYKYDDGNFYVEGDRLNSREALAKWSRYLSETGDNVGHIVKTFSYDTTSQSELCNRALTALKKCCEPEENYEIEIVNLPDNVRIGDMINIVDDEGGLYLAARILKLEISVSNKTQKATLGDYLIKDSGISQQVEDLAAQFKELAKNRAVYIWIAYADDDQGNGISLNPEGKSYMGTAANRTVSIPDLSDTSVYTWVRVKGDPGEDGTPGPAGADGKTSYFHVKYSAVANPTTSSQMSETPDVYIGTYVDYTQADSTDPKKYTWARFQGIQGENGIPGIDGTNGKTSYLHIKYSNDGGKTFTGNNGETPGAYIGQYVDFTQTDSSTVSSYTWSKIKGEDGADGKDGTDGRGMKSTETTYQASASGTAVPTGTWSTSIPTVAAGRYLWTRTVITYTDGTDSTLYSVGKMGSNGTDGTDGKGISSITEYYLATASGSNVTTTTAGWTTSVQTITVSKKYLWNYEVIEYTDGTSTTTSPKIIGVYGNTGATGATGNGIQSVTNYYLATASGSGVTTETDGWTTDVQTITTSKKYLWNYEVITYTNGNTTTTVPVIIGAYGNTGTTARIYMLAVSDTMIKKGADNSLTPGSITLNAYYRNGTSASRAAYSGRFVIEESTDGSIFSVKYTSSANESSKVYTPSGSDVMIIRCTLYAAGGTTNALDSQAIHIMTDISNIKIGGRNLFVNTNNPDASDRSKLPNLLGHERDVAAAANNIYLVAEHGVRVALGANAVYACYYMNGTTTSAGSCACFEEGQKYTISFDWTAKAYSGASATGDNYLRLGLYTDASGAYKATWIYNFFKYTNDILGTEQSGRVEYTFTFPSGVSVAMLRFYFSNSTSGYNVEGDYLELRNLKLEKGNTATDWTPAPEEMLAGITRYYLIQDATAAVPEKPTIYPPPSKWITPEPEYTLDVKKSMYLVDLVEFIGGRWAYSEVSLSGYYEAAKEAYLKAQAAQEEIDKRERIISSNTAPEDTGALWIDTSATPPLAKRYDGSTWVVVNDTTGIVEQIYKTVYDVVEKSQENVLIQIGEKTYLKDEIDQLLSDVSTQYTQTSQSFDFKFNQLISEITNLSDETEVKFTEVNKYIRFIDGAIIIGVEGNPLILKMQNDRISFLENGNEVAYISNRRMYITDVEVINSLTIGNFAFLPRNNGNLTFKKVRG